MNLNIMINSKNAPKAIGPYSQGIISDGFLFTSGQIGINPKTGEIKGGIVAQTTQAIQNLKSVIKAAGAKIDDVVKTTVYLKDISHFKKMNAVYSKFFISKPARSTVEVSRLPKDALIEIESIVSLEK